MMARPEKGGRLRGATFATGCGSANDRPRPAADAVPAPDTTAAARPQFHTWQVTIGSRGGFTGGGSGWIIHASGRVVEWSQVTPGDPITSTEVGQATPAAIAALEQALRAPELQASKLQESGNMTAFLEWTDPPRILRWSWPVRGGPSAADPPAAVAPAHAAARAAVASARRGHDGVEEMR